MAKYLITLSSSTYSDKQSAESAINAAGITIIQSFALGLSYEVDVPDNELAALEGVELEMSSETPVTAEMQSIAYNTNHLKALVSSTLEHEYQPKYTGEGTDVYLIDTGINTNHDEFAGVGINNLYTNFTDHETISAFDDEAGHGTAVGSMIAGVNIGVAHSTSLHNVKLFNSHTGDITVGEIIYAIDAVVSHHLENQPEQLKVACMPWTVERNDFIDAKIAEMQEAGIIVVASAGNNGEDVNTKSPAGVDTIITVGAHDIDYNVGAFTNIPRGADGNEYFSNFGAELDIFAPGVDVTAADISETSNSAYVLLSGTSIAGGIIAGLVTHYIQRMPGASAAKVKDSMLAEGHILGSTLLSFDETNGIDYDSVYKAVGTTERAGTDSFATIQSGTIATVQDGTTVTVDLDLHANATAVAVLDFAPTPDWITLDIESGVVTIAPNLAESTVVPGKFLFAVKGTVNDVVSVEEYSVNVYATDESELDDASSYYYDADASEYDEVVNYQVAPFIKA